MLHDCVSLLVVQTLSPHLIITITMVRSIHFRHCVLGQRSFWINPVVGIKLKDIIHLIVVITFSRRFRPPSTGSVASSACAAAPAELSSSC